MKKNWIKKEDWEWILVKCRSATSCIYDLVCLYNNEQFAYNKEYQDYLTKHPVLLFSFLIESNY